MIPRFAEAFPAFYLCFARIDTPGNTASCDDAESVVFNTDQPGLGLATTRRITPSELSLPPLADSSCLGPSIGSETLLYLVPMAIGDGRGACF